ncbi:MAG: conjugal transfer protein TrbE [Desulfobulbus sp.]|jgi:type IV secretion/conjugal transfer VirB4 family ATPase
MMRLKDYRSSAQGLPDLLPWAALVAPGVVLNKDGSLLAGWKVRGQDTASSTFNEMAWISSKTNDALRQLGTGWMLNVNAVREFSRAYPTEASSRFPDPVTQMIDDERREFFGSDWCYATTTVLCLSYKPNVQAARMARQAKRNREADLFGETLEYFQVMLHQVEDTLTTVLRMERLQERETSGMGMRFEVSDLLAHLQQCLTGENQLIRVPPAPMYLDAVLGAGDLVLDGTTPMLGDQYINIVSLGGFPLESWPGMLSRLDSLALPYRFSIRFLFLDQWDAVREINKYRKGWQQSMTRVIDQLTSKKNPRINRDAANMHEDAEQAEMEVRSGAVGAGFLTAGIVLMDRDKRLLEEMARDVRRLIMGLGFSGRIETINTLEAWLGSHPGNSWADVRRPLVNTMNLADFLPLSTAWTGHAFNPCPFYPEYSRSLAILTTDGNTPYRLNLHEGDVGHTVVLGPTGSGKSTLLGLIAAQFRAYEDSSIFVFDKGCSMFALAHGAGGDHYDIGRDTLSFAPLQRIDESEEEFAWAANWIANLAELQKLVILPAHRNAIHQALDTLRHNPGDMRSLTDFWHLVQDQELKDALRHYTRHGALGHLLDAKTDTLELSRFVVFEIESLMEMGEANLIPVLEYLFHRIEKALTGQPGLLMLDEAWIMLGHPVFQRKIREWFKTYRRKNCIVLLATQSISDAANSGIMDVIIESCPTKFFLANLAAEEELPSQLYRQAGLNERQINIIAKTMSPKQDYYIVQPSGRRRVQLALGPKTLAFVGASDGESVDRVRTLMEQHPEDWRQIWLQERGAI